jgi:hypothetical protein
MLLAAMLVAAAPAQACRTTYAPHGFEADDTLLLGVASGEYVSVVAVSLKNYDRSSLYPEETNVPVRGYVVRVQAFHHAQAGGLAAVFEGSGSKAILVPWGYRGDCKTARWDETAGRWIASGEPAVFAAKLRSVAAPDGTPIFDVFSAHFEPYPTAKLIRDRISEAIRGGRGFLTAQEYFIFGASLPLRDGETGGIIDPGQIRRWVEENPDLATRWPAVESLETLREHGEL